MDVICVRDYIVLECNLSSKGCEWYEDMTLEPGLMGTILESAPCSLWQEQKNGDFSFPCVTFKIRDGFIMNVEKF